MTLKTIKIYSGGTRDMTRAAFREAAKRNGFKLGPFGLELADSKNLHSIGYLFDAKTKRILRRASLAYAIQRREQIRQEAGQ